MLILHFSLTPLAGSPIRICRALNMLEGVESRLVLLDSKGYIDRAHPVDLVWENDKEKVIELVKSSDVLHLHNYIDLKSTQFSPLSFLDLWKDRKPIVRQFHSNPELIARINKTDISEVNRCPIPKLVLAQYQERFFPTAKIIPNIVFPMDQDSDLGRPNDRIRICYAPTNFRSSRSKRWDTKGYPETLKILNKFMKRPSTNGLKVELDIIEQVTHEECLRRKAKCDIALDDMITGSYHMSTLESLMLGSLAITYTDDRVQKAIRTVSGRDDFPAVNVRLEDLEHVLLYLIDRPGLVREIGRHSREWMSQHWAPERMALKFVEVYREVIDDPHASFPARFSIESDCGRFLNQDVYDVLWESRHDRWPKESPKILKLLKSKAGSLARGIGIR